MKSTAKFALTAIIALSLYPSGVTAQTKGEQKTAALSVDPALTPILSAESRKDDAARDKYRHPAETLAFFQMKANMTVAEYSPGGGWFTKILIPYLATSGKYLAIGPDSATLTFNNRAREAATKGWPERFPGQAAGWTGVDAKTIGAFESDELPAELVGQIDRIVIFRSMHGMLNGNRADNELQNLHKILKDDGMIGVEQHRANSNAAYAWSDGSKGYLRQKDVVALFELNGFELVSASEINANPKDTKDYPGGVWTLPPTREGDPENDAKYQTIGESDRMTLLFRKRP